MNVNTVVFKKAVNYGFGQSIYKCTPNLDSVHFHVCNACI